jgi:putative endonuclease
LAKKQSRVRPSYLVSRISYLVSRISEREMDLDFKDRRHQFGWDAEQVAAEHLASLGWRIEAHRWKLGRHDLDLIARKADLVAFIEVKARQSARFGGGEEAISRRKRSVIERVAWSWILKHGQGGDRYRFDVVTLLGMGPAAQITHLEDAWRPGWR